ncbi:hypothetical protein ACJX0J_012827, partial [Zea mays]
WYGITRAKQSLIIIFAVFASAFIMFLLHTVYTKLYGKPATFYVIRVIDIIFSFLSEEVLEGGNRWGSIISSLPWKWNQPWREMGSSAICRYLLNTSLTASLLVSASIQNHPQELGYSTL